MSKVKQFFAAFIIVMLLTSPASLFAHSKMTRSVPDNGAIIENIVSEISLSFTKPIRLTVVQLIKLPEGKNLSFLSQLPKTFVKDVKLTVNPLDTGMYQVQWIAMGKDGHIMRGTFSFSVKHN